MAEKRPEKNYCIIDDKQHTITFVADKISKKQAAEIKGLIAVGYEAIRVSADVLYPPTNLYKKEKVLAFLKTISEEEEKKFIATMNTEAKDKKGAVKTCKNGKARKKGYVGALKEFKEKYKDEYLEWLKGDNK